MYDFHTKIKILRSCEPTVYATCLALLDDEEAACEAAKEALTALFRHSAFWQSGEQERQAIIRRHCAASCMAWRKLATSVS